MIPASTDHAVGALGAVGARVDMHCHSSASELAKLGVQRSLGLPECATPPHEVYELARSRAMDFVTITDHDTIAGCLEIADFDGVFISEELTTWFPGEEQAVHVLCYGITVDDHHFLQENARDLETCAAYLREREITCALAHPFFTVAAPLSARHRRRLAQLFEVWEVRNGARARELNMPAAIYTETRGGTGIGGSDDHAGVDIGRTFTETPAASTPEQFLAHVRAGRAEAHGKQGSAAKWAHAALALGARTMLANPTLDIEDAPEVQASAATLLAIAERVVSDGAMRGGVASGGLDPAEVRALLRSWLDALDLPDDPGELLALLKADGFSHSELARRARRVHERRLREAAASASEALVERSDYAEAGARILDAIVPAIPYVPSLSILGAEKAKLNRRDDEPRRVAVVVDAVSATHGVAHTVERIREHGVPGYDVEIIGTDACVDRRLPAVAEIEIPLYRGMTIGVPSVPELVETLADGAYDLVHLTAPGPAGVGAALSARIGGLPTIASHHTDFAAYAGQRSDDRRLELATRMALSAFYAGSPIVLSPSEASDESLVSLGVERDRIGRWVRGVDARTFDPAKRDESALPGEVRVLYAGRLSREKGIELLAESFLLARERDPRLHLLLAGGGPEEDMLRQVLGDTATFLGWLGREQLAVAYASSDLFLFASETDTYGQVIVEAQASGLPVVAVDAGGPSSLIADRRTGWLCPADPEPIAAAVAQLAASEFLRERIAREALVSVRDKSWSVALDQLARGYDRALAPTHAATRFTTRSRAA